MNPNGGATRPARCVFNSTRLFREPVQLEPAAQPMLFVVVDTEEEFDWNAPFSREHVSVRAMRHVGRGQALFDRYGVRPTYVIDYPVATRREGYEPLREIAATGRCTIGAHLHPWVNPPFDEVVNRPNSFACNLSPALEAAKLARLTDAIQETFGHRPTVYKAGRYGIGASTVETLESLAFEVDCSVNPSMDFSDEQGPDFTAFDAQPFVFGPARRLLELPCTTGYAGLAASAGPALHRLASSARLRPLRLIGMLARLGLSNRIMLSPEGNSAAEMRELTHALLRTGVRTFTLSFHSPSLEAGHTPYVRTSADLSEFLDRIDAFLDCFFGEIGGVAATPADFLALAFQDERATSASDRVR